MSTKNLQAPGPPPGPAVLRDHNACAESGEEHTRHRTALPGLEECDTFDARWKETGD